MEDPVKVLDKGAITSFFLGGGPSAGDGAEDVKGDNKDDMDMSDDDGAEGKLDSRKDHKDDKRHRSGSRDHHHSSSKHHHHHDRDKDRDHRRRSGSDPRHHHKDRDKDKRHSRDHHHHKDKDRHSKSSTKFKEEEEDRKIIKKGSSSAKSAPITNEQLVENLGLIVDKREKQPMTPGKDIAEGAGEGDAAAKTAETPVDSRQITPATTPVPADGESTASTPVAKDLSATTAPHVAMDGADADKERELLLKWLSPAGFEVNSPEVAMAIEADREATRRITALEIPVGDSSSILRAGAGGEVMDKSAVGGGAGGSGGTPASTAGSGAAGVGVSVKKRDFARVLEIYQEVVLAEEKSQRSGSRSASGKSGSSKRPAPPPPPSAKGAKVGRVSGSSSTTPKVEGNPIIVVPNAMTSCITMANATFFFGKDAVYVPRDQAMKRPDAGKRGGTFSVTRKVAPRLGGGEITYDIIDNPTSRLKDNEWNRVVAVVAQGASWQFKGWKYDNPVDLFSRSFGFYIGFEGANIPNELKGWNVKLGKVNKDRRGLDNVCLASFWNG